jgi:hypothetical protein
MSTHATLATPLPIAAAHDPERLSARQRFAVIVRALATLSSGSAPREPDTVPDTGPTLADEPTRRVNRLRRLFGRLRRRPLQGGKSRQRTR